MANLNWWGFDLNAFLLVFIVLNVVNVIIQTIKSIATVSWGKWGASIANALAYSLYTVVVIFMNADGLGIIWKAIIIGLANLVGVYVVKVVEEKKRKDRLWQITITIPHNHFEQAKIDFDINNVSFSYQDITKYVVFTCYCATQKDTTKVVNIAKKYQGKLFASENKLCL